MKQGQSRTMSLVESTASVVAGFIITVLIQYWVYPMFGVSIPATQALIVSFIIVIAAFVKNFSIRRLFNFVDVKNQRSYDE